MSLVDQVEFFLDSNQAKVCETFLQQLARIVVILGCRGSGKSGLIRAIILMLALSSKKQVLYFSQSNGNSLDQFQKLVDDDTVKSYLIQSYDREPFTTKPVPTMRFANGSEVLFFSLEDHVSKRGYHPHAIITDESQSISETSWSRVVYPMRVRLGSKPAPILCFGSCPDADNHWFYRLYEEGLTQPNKRGARSFTFDIKNSLAFKGEKGQQLLDEARANMAEDDFLGEFMLRPGGRGDAFFRAADIDACVKAYDPRDVDWKFEKGTILAFDPALGRQDPAAFVVMDLKGNIIASVSIRKTLSDTDQVKELVEAAKKYRSLVVVESNSTAYMTYVGALKQLLPHGVKDVPLRAVSTKSGEAKNVLCKQFAWQIEHKVIHINPECKELVKQLKDIRDYKTPSGQIQLRASGTNHDDEAFSAVIAAEALAKGWSPYLIQGFNPASRLL